MTNRYLPNAQSIANSSASSVESTQLNMIVLPAFPSVHLDLLLSTLLAVNAGLLRCRAD
jgi:hypothetical protein